MSDPRDVLTASAPPDTVVSYGDLPDQVADVRLPDPVTGTKAPLTVVVHGGFWRAAYDRAHTGPLCADLASRGIATVSVEYRRTGQEAGGWPGTFDDIALAVDRLPALVAETVDGQVDTERVVLLGHSAGGHLALWSAGRHQLPAGSPWRRTAPLPVRGVVALAPVADLARASLLGLGGGATDALLGGPPGAAPERYVAADPMRLLPIDVPAVLVHGEDDENVPIDQSVLYAATAREEADSDIELRRLDGVEHFGVISPASPAWCHVVTAVESLLV